jgi:hypothetical protein
MSTVAESVFFNPCKFEENSIQDQRIIFWWHRLATFGTSVHERVGLLFNIKLLFMYFVKYLKILVALVLCVW